MNRTQVHIFLCLNFIGSHVQALFVLQSFVLCFALSVTCQSVLEEHADDGHHSQAPICDLSCQFLFFAACRSLDVAVWNTQEAGILEITWRPLGVVHLTQKKKQNGQVLKDWINTQTKQKLSELVNIKLLQKTFATKKPSIHDSISHFDSQILLQNPPRDTTPPRISQLISSKLRIGTAPQFPRRLPFGPNHSRAPC